MQQARADRAVELRVRLDRLNAEGEAVAAALTEFLFSHKTPHGDYFTFDLADVGALREQEFQLRRRECEIMKERDAVLRELADLTSNPGETVHVEGKAVHA